MRAESCCRADIIYVRYNKYLCWMIPNNESSNCSHQCLNGGLIETFCYYFSFVMLGFLKRMEVKGGIERNVEGIFIKIELFPIIWTCVGFSKHTYTHTRNLHAHPVRLQTSWETKWTTHLFCTMLKICHVCTHTLETSFSFLFRPLPNGRKKLFISAFLFSCFPIYCFGCFLLSPISINLLFAYAVTAYVHISQVAL